MLLLRPQVLLSTATCCWGMTSSAKLVVIMGTQYYDGTGLGASDYPVTDLLQMLGRASRPGVDEVGSGGNKQQHIVGGDTLCALIM